MCIVSLRIGGTLGSARLTIWPSIITVIYKDKRVSLKKAVNGSQAAHFST